MSGLLPSAYFFFAIAWACATVSAAIEDCPHALDKQIVRCFEDGFAHFEQELGLAQMLILHIPHEVVFRERWDGVMFQHRRGIIW